MEQNYRLVVNIFGYEFVQNQFTILCLESVFQKKNMFVAENFIGSLVDKYCTHTVYTWWYIISLSLYIFAFETWVALSFGGALSKK